MVAQHYRWDFIGLSTDSKPTPATSEKVTDGSTFYCSDNSKLYVWYKDQWYEKEDTGGGEPYVLPIASSETLGGIKVGSGLSINSETGVLSSTGGGGEGIKTLTEADYNYPADNPTSVALWLLPSGIYKVADPAHDQIKISNTINNYDSNLQSPLFIVMYGSSRDCSIIGYANSGNGKGRCWTVAVANGAHTAVMNLNMGLQATTGSSSSDVMTQNATTSMVFNDPSSLRQVKIGDSTTSSGQNSVAIGYGAVATSQRSIAIGAGASCVQPNSIAIGYGSAANQQGVMCVGGVLNGGGYNNSNYRVIRGVYDGQELHDGATVAQGNTLSTSAPTTSTVGVLGQLYTDTTNMHTYQCTAIDTTDPDNPSYTWTQRW